MFDPLARNRVFPEYQVPNDGAAEVSALIKKAHRSGGLATRLKAAASLADSTPITSDPALAQERDAGIAAIKAAHLAPQSGMIGEGLITKLSREMATRKGDSDDADDEPLDILKRELRRHFS